MRDEKIHREAQTIVADSKEWTTILSDYLLGRLLNIICNKHGSILQQKKVKKDKLGNQSLIELEHKDKHLELINFHRIPRSSSNRVCCLRIQYNLVYSKIRLVQNAGEKF